MDIDNEQPDPTPDDDLEDAPLTRRPASTVDLGGHPWKSLKTGTALTFADDLAWAYNNATRIIRRDLSTGGVRFDWRAAATKPPSNGALTCLSWAAFFPAKFHDTCQRAFQKVEQPEDEVRADRAEKKSQEELEDILRQLKEEADQTFDPYFYERERK